MTNYARLYRFGFTPWERYATAAAASIAVRLDREEAERSRPLGRALDLGCGRGLYTPELAQRGWEAVGIDYVLAAIEAAMAKSRGAAGLGYVVGDVTRLPSAHLGTFDFFLDIGCFQGLDTGQRLSEGNGISALANPGATLLLLSFGPSRWRWLVERRIAGGGPDRLRGLGDARIQAGRHRGPGLADEQDRPAVVQAPLADLARTTLSCLALSGRRPMISRYAHSCRNEGVTYPYTYALSCMSPVVATIVNNWLISSQP
jgi:SAM-dependent methyltransferase